MDGDKRVTIGQASRRLNLSTQRVRELCDRGDLPYVRGPYEWRLIDADAVEDLAARRDQKEPVAR